MSEEYDDGRGLDPRSRADIEQIAAAALEEDGQDPLDEATRLAIRHRDETELTAWLAPDGFALLVDAELSLVVRPEARGEGLGGTLLGHVLEVAADEPLNAWSHGDHPAAAVLAARTGFTRARDLWVMGLDAPAPVEGVAQPDHSLVEEVAQQPLVPEEVAKQPSRRTRDPADEITIRAFRPTDEAELLRVNAAAFAAHPEQGAMDATNLAQRMAEPWFDPAGLLVAEEDDRLLGFHWTKVHPDGGGEVYVVAVDPAAQGRGLGRQLTRAGLDHLARVGVPDVHLYVEADNTAAVKLYERLGFTHAADDTHVQYRRPAGPS